MAQQTIQTTDDLNAGRVKINANFDELYAAGTWTPVLYGSSVAGSPTYITQSGVYNRVANVVFAGFRVSISATGGISGDVRISGLPYDTASESLTFGQVFMFKLDLAAGYSALGCRAASSGPSYIEFRASGDNIAPIIVPHTYLLSDTVLWGQVIYRASSL